MMFRAVTTVLNERAHLKMVIRSVPDSVSLSLGRTERLGPTALHRAQQVDVPMNMVQMLVPLAASNTDYIGVNANTGSGSKGNYTMYVLYGLLQHFIDLFR